MNAEHHVQRLRHSGVVEFFQFDETGTTCPLCNAHSVRHVSRYPAASERLFINCVIMWCDACGGGFVPDADKLLGNYYSNQYAKQNRGDREMPPEEYFAALDGSNYAKRAASHLVLLRRHHAKFDRVLDFGSGPGYFLKLAEPKEGFAVEPDESSKKYIDYIGAKIVTLDDIPDDSLDLIEASHSLEHLSAQTINPTLAALAAKLKPSGGLILMEVPHSALSHLRVRARHEPHTLFFSAKGFQAAIIRAGLTPIVSLGRGKEDMEQTRSPIYSPDTSDGFLGTSKKSLTILARRMTEEERARSAR